MRYESPFLHMACISDFSGHVASSVSVSGASTDLLRRLHAHMAQNDVDFIGGDFNMSAFSTAGDVFANPEFRAPGNSLQWGLGALEDANRERTGFLIMPRRPYGMWMHTAATNSTTQIWQPTFLIFCIYAPPTSGACDLCTVFLSLPLPLANLTARTCTCFQYGVDEADELLLNKIT